MQAFYLMLVILLIAVLSIFVMAPAQQDDRVITVETINCDPEPREETSFASYLHNQACYPDRE